MLKNYIEEMNKWKEMESRKSTMENEVVAELEKTYSSFRDIYFTQSGFTVSTERHSKTVNSYSTHNDDEPVFTCTGNMDLPETIKEFQKLRENIVIDRIECIEIVNIVSDLYNWKEGE